MACRTVDAEATLMDVLLFMATGTNHRYFLRYRSRQMARVTGQPLVRAGQCKLRLLVVVKLPKSPAVGGMTGGTIWSKRCLVNIFRCVATDATNICCGKILADMAALTRYHRVQPYQRHLGQPVVKLHLLPPVARAVATGTISAQ